MARKAQEEAQFAPPSAPIEARSLSSFTTLAANPPNYPRNPTQERLDSLVLYIVRVPGSRDVFLSPLKPPTKSSISPESINSSLYYLHVAAPSDEALLKDIENERKLEEEKKRSLSQQEQQDPDNGADTLSTLNRVRRKPVPGNELNVDTVSISPAFVEGDKPDIKDKSAECQSADGASASVEKKGFLEITRKPISQDNNASSRPSETEKGHVRKWSNQAVSPRPIRETFHRLRNSFDISPGRASLDAERPAIKPKSPVMGRLGAFLNSQGQSMNVQLPVKARYSPELRRETPIPSPFLITLIRRDPTHGIQWNVGTITNCDGFSKLFTDGSTSIEITSPGYTKFANKQPISFEGLDLDSADSIMELIKRSSLKPPDSSKARDNAPKGPFKFARKLKPLTPQLPNETFELSPPRRKIAPSTGVGNYMFTSPWNGTCTFGPGTNSRTLRCRHVIPTPPGALTPPNHPPNPAVTVAEIRLNLPTFPSPITRQRSTSLNEDSNLKGTYYSHSPPTADENRLDLSLARELAGGGMRGNSAKLGKLIIHDEGLKMVDLLVAASMGVFWRMYDDISG